MCRCPTLITCCETLRENTLHHNSYFWLISTRFLVKDFVLNTTALRQHFTCLNRHMLVVQYTNTVYAFIILISLLCVLNAEAVVYVVPVFEMQHGKPPPATKSKLLEAVRSGLARQFYVSRCFKCHSPTDYAKWLR